MTASIIEKYRQITVAELSQSTVNKLRPQKQHLAKWTTVRLGQTFFTVYVRKKVLSMYLQYMVIYVHM
jgi:hypothetical protein